MDNKSLSEFQAFLQANEVAPKEISRSILARVGKDLNPSNTAIFGKLGAIQIFVGLITLVFCPQLGVGPLIGEHGIMMLFMHYGPIVCAAACGSFFLFTSVLLASFMLRPEELRGLRNRHLVGIPILSAVSLILLMLLGGSATPLLYLVWLLGAILGGEVGSQIVIAFRLRKLTS